jgi:hypothetical protein
MRFFEAVSKKPSNCVLRTTSCKRSIVVLFKRWPRSTCYIANPRRGRCSLMSPSSCWLYQSLSLALVVDNLEKTAKIPSGRPGSAVVAQQTSTSCTHISVGPGFNPLSGLTFCHPVVLLCHRMDHALMHARATRHFKHGMHRLEHLRRGASTCAEAQRGPDDGIHIYRILTFSKH